MKIPWGTIAHFGAEIARTTIPAITSVEIFGNAVGLATGAQKQQSVVESVQTQLARSFVGLDPLLLFNPRVVAAIRAVIDSIVRLQQTIADELAKQGSLPPSIQPPPV